MSDQHITPGSYGAKVQSWRAANPRDLLKQVKDQNPGADEEALLKLFDARLQDEPDREAYLASIIEYWFANNFRSLTGPLPARAAAAENKRESRKAVAAAKATIKARATRMVLLDLTMPNGKALRDCTGRDCGKFGGWLTKVAGKVKPGEVVGRVLSEAQVRSLFQAR